MKIRLISLLFIFVQLSYCFAQQKSYAMAGPYEVVARDGQYAFTKGGSERDMKAAWDLAREVTLQAPLPSRTLRT